ncbi:RHS repeat-associated core domain-containing protein [Chitinophaga deserti]|uniref:RHS repeat-associated core domain-containing protein n=1 Tax=Chitinophaga deserti TaxID=2164099 RepID=UPI00130044B5|nr:RHS repeat-associated core domain-containing protein [Chitinophaga deserti]
MPLNIFNFRKFLFAVCCLLMAATGFAATEPYQQQLAGKIKAGDTLVLRDEKFRNPSYDWSKILNRKVSNNIRFELVTDSLFRIKKPFTCKLELKVEYWTQPSQADPITEENVTLEVRYDTAAGGMYTAVDEFDFLNGHLVKLTVNSISSAELGEDLPGIFRIVSQVAIDRNYVQDPAALVEIFARESTGEQAQLQPEGQMMAMAAPVTVTPNRVSLVWGAPNDGIDDYDLEWTFIDEFHPDGTFLSNPVNHTNTAVLERMFRNNASRVTLKGHEYHINLVHNTRYLLIRMRTAPKDPVSGLRNPGTWSYQIKHTPVGGTEQINSGVIILTNTWHRSAFNWQYSATFAEEGKRKEVVSYFDKSLKNRQTVTLSNHSNEVASEADLTTVAQSVIYDQYGRPTVEMLPAPLNGVNILDFQSQLNKKANGTQYTFVDVNSGTFDCNFTFPAMGNTAGAGKYYSTQNGFKALGNHSYVPDAEGYPFSGKIYMNDNTGRLAVQGGVGPKFQPQWNAANPDLHATRFYYSKPSQFELYRLFGNDIGDATHYSKTTTVDPNGQISVSYTNLSGKTIATGLSGPAPANLDGLPGKPAAEQKTIDLFTNSAFAFDPVTLKLTASQVYVAQEAGTRKLTVDVANLLSSSTIAAKNICTKCEYEIVLTVTSDCADPLIPQVFTIPVGVPGTNCTPLTGSFRQEVTAIFANTGQYYIRLELRIKQNRVDQLAEQSIAINDLLKKQFDFVKEELEQIDFSGCFDDCQTCYAALGTKVVFMQKIRDKMTAMGINMTTYGSQVDAWSGPLYDNLSTKCAAARGDCGEDPCANLKRTLRKDVSPGGQYALFNAAGEPVETSIHVLFNKFRVVFPERTKDEPGYLNNMVQNDEGDMVSVHDKAFTLTDLVKYWKQDWEDLFVIYHPEYCAYTYCVSTTSYQKWDEKLNKLALTAADALILSTKSFDRNDPVWLTTVDPYFLSVRGAAYLTAFKADLQNYSINVKGLSMLVNKDVNRYVDYVLYCSDRFGSASTAPGTEDNTWGGCAPDVNCRVIDREWRMYLDAYMELKRKYYQIDRAANECAVITCPVGTPVSLGSGCPPTGAFSLKSLSVSGSLQTVTVRYEGGNIPRAATVTLHYPSNYDGLTQVASVAFAAGDKEKTISIASAIQVNLVKVKSVTCSGGSSIIPCNGPSYTLDLGTGGRKSGFRTWDKVVGGTVVTYKAIEGYKDQPPTGYCSGAPVPVFYSCLWVKTPNNTAGEYLQNVWLVICPATACASPGSFAATTGNIPNLTFFNSSTTVYLYPNTAPTTVIANPGCINPVRTWYDCYSVTLSGVTYNYRNVSVFSCPPACSFTLIVTSGDGDLYIRRNPSETWYYYVSPSDPGSGCPDIPGDQAQFYPCIIFKRTNGVADTLVNVWMFTCIEENPGFAATNESMLLAAEPCDAYKSKQSRLGLVDYNAAIDTAGIKTQGAGQLQQQIQNACANQADGWISRLRPGMGNVLPADSVALRNKLIELCNKGVDIYHPYGASTLPPHATLPSGAVSFKDVLKSITGLTQLTADYNPWLLDGPYPYKTPAQTSLPLISSSDPELCSRLTTLKADYLLQPPGNSFHTYLTNRFGTANTLTVAELTELERSCTSCKYLLNVDIQVPVFLTKEAKGCITAQELNTAWNALLAENLTNFTSAHPNYERIFTNYFNHKWGFTLSFTDYQKLKALYDQSPSTTAILCNEPVFAPQATDPYDCLLTLVQRGVWNGMQRYDSYIAEAKRQFKQEYISDCSKALAKLEMTHMVSDYHFTLYYYDQSGQLVKTVPPEGVKLLSDAEIAAAAEAKETITNCTYTGPTTATDMALTNTYLTSAFESGKRSVEMWVYGNELPHGQVLMSTGINGYLMNACIGSSILELDLYKLVSGDVTNNSVEITRSRHYKVQLNAANVRPWMHIVLTGENIGQDNGTLNIYVNGELCPAITTGTAPATCGWEIGYSGSTLVLPSNTSILKHLRGYSRDLSISEVQLQYAKACLDVDATLAGVRQHWGRFNVPVAGSPTTANNTTTETRFARVYPDHWLNSSYSFQSLNGVVRQVTPDGGLSNFWYDYIGRLVFSKNAIQTGRNSYTKYDAQGRVEEVGEITGNTWAGTFIAKLTAEEWLTTNKASKQQITRTKYDLEDLDAKNKDFAASFSQQNLRQRVAATYMLDADVVNTSAVSATYYSYDLTGNVKSVLFKLPAMSTPVYKRLDYNYDQASGKVNTVRYQLDAPDQFLYDYDYDAENRLMIVRTDIKTTGTDKWTLQTPRINAQYYYYKHGPLSRMELGGNLQGVDYAYTLQGWLRAINGEKLSASGNITAVPDMGQDGKTGAPNSTFKKDVYAYSLQYYKGDYKPVWTDAGGSTANEPVFTIKWENQALPAGGTGKELFNGNISRVTAALRDVSARASVGYSYRYDQLNRLTQMAYHPSLTNSTPDFAATLAFAEKIEYDANGNIKKYERNGDRSIAGEAPMDRLSYNYNYLNENGVNRLVNNRLRSVFETEVTNSHYTTDLKTGQSVDNYGYDAIGNLIRDNQEGITGINWSVYGKISQINKGANTIVYKYDASGNRIYKETTFSGVKKKTWYLRDATGNTLAVYSGDATTNVTWEEQHLYGSSRLGYWNAGVANGGNAATSWNTPGKTLYELTNHLGNVLGTISGNAAIPQEAEVVHMQDYYPFGMGMPGRSFKLGTSSYRYGFNGKENDNEVKGVEGSQQDYGMRIYDPRIAKFLSVDPIAGKYPYYSPYHFAGNSPIISIDIDGLEPSAPRTQWKFIGNVNGQKLYEVPEQKKIYYVAETANWGVHGNSYFQYTNPETNKWAGNFTPTDYEENGPGGFPTEDIRASQNRNQEYSKSWKAFQDGFLFHKKTFDFVEGPFAFTVLISTGFIGGGQVPIARFPAPKMVNQMIGGFYVRGSVAVAEKTYLRTIQSLAAGEKASTIPELLGVFEKEAIEAGAEKIIIRGIDIVNPKLFNPKMAEKLGYMYEQTADDAIQLIKNLVPGGK